MGWSALTKEVTSKIAEKMGPGGKLKPLILACGLDPDTLVHIDFVFSDWQVELLGADSKEEAISHLKKNLSRALIIFCAPTVGEISAVEFRSELGVSAQSIPFGVITETYSLELKAQLASIQGAGLLEKGFGAEAVAELFEQSIPRRLESLLEDFELLRGFIEETKGIIEQIEALSLQLERSPGSKEILNNLFGMVHTIKGASSFFEPKTLHQFFHRFEDVLKQVQSGTIKVSGPVISAVLKVVDTAKKLLGEFDTQKHQHYSLEELCRAFSPEALTANQGEVRSTPSSDGSDSAFSSLAAAGGAVSSPLSDEEGVARDIPSKENSIKIDIELLDQFLRASGEMTVVRNMVNKTVASLEKHYSADKDVLRLSELLEELNKVNAAVQAKITEVRKVSLKNVFKALPRLVRDVTARTKKSCTLKLEGDDLRVDSSISEALNASLSHLIRNSIDHGVETSEERVRANKPETGSIIVRAILKNEQVIVEVRDDGKGIDTEVIRRKLVSKGLKTETQVAQLSDREVQEFIFESGFSTAAQTTEISGRGVGMSAVKDSVEGIGGRIRIETQKSKGSSFFLELPVPKSVHIKNCLFVLSGGQEFGVAQDQILRLMTIDGEARKRLVVDFEGGSVLRSGDGATIPLVSLGSILFPLKSQQALNKFTVVVVSTEGGKSFGLIVDEIRDFEDAVVKDLAPTLKCIGAYSGATFLSDGTVGLLLSVEGIARLAHLKTDVTRLQDKKVASQAAEFTQEKGEWLLVELDVPGVYAIPRQDVFRIEEFDSHRIQRSGVWDVIPYREHVLPILNLTSLLGQAESRQQRAVDARTQVVVMGHGRRLVGFKIKQIIDIATSVGKVEEPISPQQGIKGNLILGGKTVTVLDPGVWIAA